MHYPWIAARLPVLLLAGLFLAACETEEPETADKILNNGSIYTLDADHPEAEAVAIRDGNILAVGESSDIQRHEGPDTRVVDLDGAIVYPGFADSHVHLDGIGERELSLDLSGIDRREEFLEAVAGEAEDLDEDEWVIGRGWLETHWEPAEFPTREELDEVVPDHPVWLTRADGHGSVANTRALEKAGVDAESEAPEGGEILRDADGEPEGMLLGRAQWLVGEHVPEREAPLEELLTLGEQRSLEMGWTQLHIASGDYEELEALEELFREGQMRMRLYQALRWHPEEAEDAERLIDEGGFSGRFDGRYSVRGIKIAKDGALGSGGAALLEDYDDRDGDGYFQVSDEDMAPILEEALREGIQVWTHAIGDRANRHTLDLYEAAFEEISADERAIAEPRWRIEHAQLLHADDVDRFAELDVIPSMQPSHAIGDLHYARDRVGKERLRHAYAWRDLIDSGIPIAGGSDAPVEQGDPRIEFYAAVARRDLQGHQEDHWYPEQAVSREDALKMFTLWPAKAAFEEDVRGRIAPGKYGDFTVFDQNLLEIDEKDILESEVLMTIVGGEVLHDAR